MKKNRLIMVVSIIVCSILAVAVMAIAFNQPEHRHTHSLDGSKIYHVTNEGVYYTLKCKDDDYTEKFNTNILLDDALLVAEANDTIVLEEDIVLNHIIKLNSFTVVDGFPEGYDINVNLDLNGYTISTNIGTGVQAETIKSMFILNAPVGSIDFNILNGKLYSNELLHIFNFANNARSGQNINVVVDNVECRVTGENVTPLFAQRNSTNIKFTATNSKFISEKPSAASVNSGIGAFINSISEFNFENCELVGGDAIYVKQGTVNLNNCALTSKEHAWTANVEQPVDGFKALGSCISVESYHESAASGYTKFIININNCEMKSLNSSEMICVTQTANTGLEKGVNADSKVNIVSGTFNKRPTTEYSVVEYNSTPVNENSVWVVR